MMTRNRIEPALAERLESLTGEDGACCATDLAAEAASVRRSAGFAAASARAKALGDENRFLIASLIAKRGSMCACEVQAALGLTHATVSHHMGVLEDAQVVVSERRGKWTHYRLTREGAGGVS